VPFLAFIGGTETYGKFIRAPFPALIESDVGINCVNFGVLNAGVDVFLHEPAILHGANASLLTVLQVVGAQNTSNRFYSVHPRRNDRFVKASPKLAAIYPEVDFSEFHFTRHLLVELSRICEDRFTILRKELEIAWLARMRLLLRRIRGRVVLAWFADHAPEEDPNLSPSLSESSEPLFVTRDMLDSLRANVAGFVEITASEGALTKGTDGMVFDEMEETKAAQMMGPAAHGEAAKRLGALLHTMI
jgi:hypothetical protein